MIFLLQAYCAFKMLTCTVVTFIPRITQNINILWNIYREEQPRCVLEVLSYPPINIRWAATKGVIHGRLLHIPTVYSHCAGRSCSEHLMIWLRFSGQVCAMKHKPTWWNENYIHHTQPVYRAKLQNQRVVSDAFMTTHTAITWITGLWWNLTTDVQCRLINVQILKKCLWTRFLWKWQNACKHW